MRRWNRGVKLSLIAAFLGVVIVFPSWSLVALATIFLLSAVTSLANTAINRFWLQKPGQWWEGLAEFTSRATLSALFLAAVLAWNGLIVFFPGSEADSLINGPPIDSVKLGQAWCLSISTFWLVVCLLKPGENNCVLSLNGPVEFASTAAIIALFIGAGLAWPCLMIGPVPARFSAAWFSSMGAFVCLLLRDWLRQPPQLRAIEEAGGVCVSESGLVVRLFLVGNSITDATLEMLVHLKGLASLEELQLLGTQITAAGLEHVQGLTSLESLSLRGVQVTEEGVAKLEQALPNCKIKR